MPKDIIVNKVRKTREKILIDANYDISKILQEIIEMQNKDKDKLVNFSAKEQVSQYQY